MPSAGAVCPPLIVPVRRHVTGLATNKIDTTTLIEITTGITAYCSDISLQNIYI